MQQLWTISQSKWSLLFLWTNLDHCEKSIIRLKFEFSVWLRLCSTRCLSFMPFCSVLYVYALLCSVLLCSVLLCSVLFCSVWLYSALFRFALFCAVLFCSAPILKIQYLNTQARSWAYAITPVSSFWKVAKLETRNLHESHLSILIDDSSNP